MIPPSYLDLFDLEPPRNNILDLLKKEFLSQNITTTDNYYCLNPWDSNNDWSRFSEKIVNYFKTKNKEVTHFKVDKLNNFFWFNGNAWGCATEFEIVTEDN